MHMLFASPQKKHPFRFTFLNLTIMSKDKKITITAEGYSNLIQLQSKLEAEQKHLNALNYSGFATPLQMVQYRHQRQRNVEFLCAIYHVMSSIHLA